MALIVSDELTAVVAEFDSVLGRLTEHSTDPGGADVWAAVAAGGWLDVGARGGPDAYTVTDLVEFAVAWGRRVLPLPFTPTLLARRWVSADPPADAWLTFCFGRPGGPGVVPFGGSAATADGAGWPAAGVLDDFAPTLPLLATPSTPDAPAGLGHEAAVLFAAEALGGAQVALERAIDYAGIRRAYGQEIGRFQAVKHILADAYVDLETGRAGLVRAANEPAGAIRTAGLVARRAQRVVEAAIQVFGGIGFTWDLGIHRHYRHALAVQKLLSFG